MPRPVYIVRYLSYPFHDHWGLWIPSIRDEKVGTVIQVEGDVRSGFAHEINRNHNIESSDRTTRFTFLGNVSEEHILDCAPDEAPTTNSSPTDYIERLALSIAAPGPSMNPVSGEEDKVQGPPRKAELSDCQWWLTRAVAKLVDESILDESANAIVQETPKN